MAENPNLYCHLDLSMRDSLSFVFFLRFFQLLSLVGQQPKCLLHTPQVTSFVTKTTGKLKEIKL